ncbi:MAG: cytochrome C [Nitrospirota bacterium]|nr:cytochrome C [Nitrospirota bacterium]
MIMLKIIVSAVIISLSAFGFCGTSQAFHSGGVAECGGCHSMHTPAPGGSFLLVGTDQSSTCLSCHEHAGDTGPSSYHISTAEADMPSGVAPLQRTPGGDFGWLKKTYSFTVRGTTTTEDGATHGHNIIAVDKGYAVDPVNATAPGGTFPSAQLACNSCHDPHGQYRRLSTSVIAKAGAPIIGSGSYDTSTAPAAGQAVGVYRLLAGNGYTKASATFSGVPVAVAPASYNRTEAVTQTRVAYGTSIAGGHTTWGNWCSTCHPRMHSTGNYVHPVDKSFNSLLAQTYNQYKSSGDMTGSTATAYLSLVPFAENISSYATLATHAKSDDSYLTGASSQVKVNCISCHRAHASGWEYGLRWNMEGEFMTYAGLWPGTDTTPAVPQFHRGRTGAETQSAYYDRPASKFAVYQRVLCNKCHAKD